ncbi:MAG: hypothetical protein V1874_04085 [Spirochaetota bacterium]
MNKRIFNNKKIFLLTIILFISFVSCRFEVPVKEMTIAKSNITRAVEVKADKYAPGELKKAKDELFKSHDYIKTEDKDGLKKAVEQSIKYSNEAITKSLPLLADDTLKEARGVYEEATVAFAEKYAPEEYALAGGKIGEAESLFTGKEYWESYLKSNEAIASAAAARDKALANIAALQEMSRKIKEESAKLDAIGGREYAPDEMKSIDANLDEAGKLLENKNVKEASVKIAEADSALIAATIKTWRGYAAAKIKAAESEKARLDASPSKDAYSADLTKAGALIAESKSFYEKENYTESAMKSEEALGLLNAVSIKIEKKSVAAGTAAADETGQPEPDEGDKDGITGTVTEYIVKYNPKSRDCLWRIAMNVYKDARLWPLIYMANKDHIKDPDLIFPGQKLVVPAIPSKSEVKESKEKPGAKPEEKVPAGDAKKNGSDKPAEGTSGNTGTESGDSKDKVK